MALHGAALRSGAHPASAAVPGPTPQGPAPRTEPFAPAPRRATGVTGLSVAGTAPPGAEASGGPARPLLPPGPARRPYPPPAAGSARPASWRHRRRSRGRRRQRRFRPPTNELRGQSGAARQSAPCRSEDSPAAASRFVLFYYQNKTKPKGKKKKNKKSSKSRRKETPQQSRSVPRPAAGVAA